MRLTVITLLIIQFASIGSSEVGAQNDRLQHTVNRVIEDYHSRFSHIKQGFAYSELTIDSIKSLNFYVMTFFPSNNKFILLPDSIASNSYHYSVPNRFAKYKNHLVVYNDGHGLDKSVLEFLGKKSLLDSFYILPRPPVKTPEEAESINYPYSDIEEHRKVAYYIVDKHNHKIVRRFATGDYEDALKIVNDLK
jgi:hypothetical protein